MLHRQKEHCHSAEGESYNLRDGILLTVKKLGGKEGEGDARAHHHRGGGGDGNEEVNQKGYKVFRTVEHACAEPVKSAVLKHQAEIATVYYKSEHKKKNEGAAEGHHLKLVGAGVVKGDLLHSSENGDKAVGNNGDGDINYPFKGDFTLVFGLILFHAIHKEERNEDEGDAYIGKGGGFFVKHEDAVKD